MPLVELDEGLSRGTAPWRDFLIEGDNFQALRFLRAAFKGSVKCIYIDPLRNTGKRDIVHSERYLSADDAFRHTAWLEVLFRRLSLARDLVREDGVLFVSSDDENRAYLELLLSQIWPRGRRGSLVWRLSRVGDTSGKGASLSVNHEHILVWAGDEFAFQDERKTCALDGNPDLFRGLVDQSTGPGDIVLDFFAGSTTTVQAVAKLNERDAQAARGAGKPLPEPRRWIMLSSTEATADEPDKNVCLDTAARRLEALSLEFLLASRVGAGPKDGKLAWVEDDDSVVAYVRELTAAVLDELEAYEPPPGKTAGATAYAIRLATSAGSLASAPLYTKTDYSANVIDLSAAPISDATTYYAQAGATVDGSLRWGKVSSFKTDFSPAATPSFSPAGGSYTTDKNVTISCTTSGATIYYTTGGSTPTTASTKYTSPVTVTVNPATTLKAIATAPGYTTSAIGSAVYSSVYSLSMALVAGGTFYNGTSNVTISSFHMSATDITQAQYLAITGVNPSYFTGDPSRPVEMVSWYDAVEFCNKLSDHDGLTDVYTITSATVTMDRTKSGYRLPTEMEWEWAAIGGLNDSIASDFSGGINKYGYLKGYAGSSETGGGQTNIGQYTWDFSNSGYTTQPVGTKAANELGLYDMSGNVVQWCWDWYGEYPSGAQTDPTGASSGWYRVIRGGSWFYDASNCSVSYRFNFNPNGQNLDIGFRVAAP